MLANNYLMDSKEVVLISKEGEKFSVSLALQDMSGTIKIMF